MTPAKHHNLSYVPFLRTPSQRPPRCSAPQAKGSHLLRTTSVTPLDIFDLLRRLPWPVPYLCSGFLRLLGGCQRTCKAPPGNFRKITSEDSRYLEAELPLSSSRPSELISPDRDCGNQSLAVRHRCFVQVFSPKELGRPLIGSGGRAPFLRTEEIVKLLKNKFVCVSVNRRREKAHRDAIGEMVRKTRSMI